MLKRWFEDVVKESPSFMEDADFVIYKGFKILKTKSGYKILDVRKLDVYSKVSESDMNILKSNGIIKGADILSHQRNLKRINVIKYNLKRLRSSKEQCERDLHTNEKFYEKKIKNIEKNIEKSMMYHSLFSMRINHFKVKYNE